MKPRLIILLAMILLFNGASAWRQTKEPIKLGASSPSPALPLPGVDSMIIVQVKDGKFVKMD